MNETNNDKINKESPIENKYLQEQRLDDNFTKQKEISSSNVLRETIDFDKILVEKTNNMVEISSLEENNINNQPIDLPNLSNSEVFGISSNNNVLNENIVEENIPPMQFMMNGGLTIHSVQEPQKKTMSKKNKKILIFSISGFLFVLLVFILLLVLKSMGIIDKPTIDEIYQNYDYNYTNDITKFVYNGNVDLYFIENEVGFDVISTNNENIKIRVIEKGKDSSLDTLKNDFDNTINESSLLESSDVIQINHMNYETIIQNNDYCILSKEILFGNNTLLVLLQYPKNTNKEDIEFKTLDIIYSTIIFENY